VPFFKKPYVCNIWFLLRIEILIDFYIIYDLIVGNNPTIKNKTMNFIKKSTIYLALLITTLLLVNCSQEESIGIQAQEIISQPLSGRVQFNLVSAPQGFVSTDSDNPTKISYNMTLSNPDCWLKTNTSSGVITDKSSESGFTYNTHHQGNAGFMFMELYCDGSGESTDLSLSISFIAKGIKYHGFLSATLIPTP
jgi:hypothetical protein